jgi:hypothetical protein
MEEGKMRARLVGLGLVIVVLAMSGVAAASASAEPPEFGRCVKVAKGTGSFKSANCTASLASGNYEWLPGPGVSNKFTTMSKAGTFVVLSETVGGSKLICGAQTSTGEYTSTKGVSNVLWRFTGCESSGGKANTPGQPEGVVVSRPLDGTLGIIKSGETPKQNKLGLDLFPQEPGGRVFEIVINGIFIVVRGSVIVPVTATKMQLTSTLKFAQAKGKQKPERFEGEPTDVLEMNVNGGSFEQDGLAFEAIQTNEKPIEANPVV